jgi:hypothetical protein
MPSAAELPRSNPLAAKRRKILPRGRRCAWLYGAAGDQRLALEFLCLFVAKDWETAPTTRDPGITSDVHPRKLSVS